ncbi:facilitated trehalose transporter Tret1-like [Belonocnema kinseyi]|uniref:facilitated trehalose transporter Tret1-like n=1 Tax=Belonocnema kinseyi TaxID=2817044 RepID=UPI00143DEA09|nr:facilitated trehalose transporter Tret1-like [Belonocnema kinseyi]
MIKRNLFLKMKLKSLFLCSNSSEFVLNSSENKIEKVIRIKGNRLLQYSAVFSASLVTFGFGSAEIWSSPALPHLRSNSSEFTITPSQGSWVASIYNIGTIFGMLLYPLLVDRIGRKYTLLIFAMPQTISWMMIFYAKNVIHLYSARIVSGIGYGGAYPVQIMYIGEIADKDIRGLLMFISRIFYAIGTLSALTAGAFLSYDNMNVTLLLFPILFILTFSTMPESPYYYLKRDQEEEARKNMCRLRGFKDSETIELELKEMKIAIIEEHKNKDNAFQILFQDKRQRKALLIATIVLASLLFSGTRVISAYSQDILSFSGFSLAPKYSTLLLSFLVTLIALPTAPLLDFVGRRIIALCSGIICTLSLVLIGFFFFLKYYLETTEMSSISWIPLATLIVFDVSCIGGLYPLSVVIAGELFSSRVKSTALSLLHIGKEPVVFVMKLSFDKLISLLGIYSVFWMYASMCFLLSLGSFLIMPETKGKTLAEIQKLMD